MDKTEYRIEDFVDYLSICETDEIREYTRTKYLPWMFKLAVRSPFARRILEGLKNYRARFPSAFDKQD